MINITRSLLASLLLAFSFAAQAQLAFTEVMTSASTNLGPTRVTQNSDYWELTNFGTNSIDLAGYRYNDSDGGLAGGNAAPFEGLTIEAGESIIFVESDVIKTPEDFRVWWGTNLPPDLKIIFYSGNGHSSGGDGLRLWSPTSASDADVVDIINFPEARRGVSFIYDPNTGLFPHFSTNGVNGAFKAEATDDVGSPGFTSGSVPLTVTQEPQDISVNPGDQAIFTIAVRGLPRPRLQWLFKGNPIEGATLTNLVVADVQTEDTGGYSVQIDNGAETLTSRVAQLALNQAPEAPQFTTLLEDLYRLEGESVTFAVMASGSPQPTYRWYFGTEFLADQTAATLTLTGLQTNNSGEYIVVASNASGSATNQALLTITPRPNLAITEVMSNSATNAAGLTDGHEDWWEVTNLGDFAVNLKGYRFDDSSSTLAAAFTFTNSIVIAPGESIIFTELMTPEAFRNWWGAKLPANVQIYTYTGNGLSSLGDAIVLWSAGATEDFDVLATAVFSSSDRGVSFNYDPTSNTFGAPSVIGVNGVFASAELGDLGSPGFITAPPVSNEPAELESISLADGIITLTFSSVSGRSYTVEYKNSLSDATWQTLTSVTATSETSTATDSVVAANGQRFYRVVSNP